MQNIKISYVTTLPLIGNAPSVTVTGGVDTYMVNFLDGDKLVSQQWVKPGETVYAGHQWYTNWIIEIYKNGVLKHIDTFNPRDKVIFIKMDGYALGDNLAWFPYFVQFKKIHNCQLICSTFFNQLFKDEYPDILFVEPNTIIHNIYAQYYVGGGKNENPHYTNTSTFDRPLQKVAADLLGLKYEEIKPKITINKEKKNIIGDYVCLSEWCSGKDKMWNGDWQQVVNFYLSKGLNVVVISKEPTQLKGVINKTGDIPLEDRISDLYHSKYFIGISSGLAWLAWSVGTHVVMISDYTPVFHEFQSGITRLNFAKKERIDNQPFPHISTEDVIKQLNLLIY